MADDKTTAPAASDKGTVDPKDAPNTPARGDVRTATGDHPSPYSPAGTPTITLHASVQNGDERHGLEVLIGDTAYAVDDNFNINVEGVPWDSQITVRPLTRPVPRPEENPEDLPEGSYERIRLERLRSEADKPEGEGSDAAKAYAHGLKEAEERSKSHGR